LKVDAKKIKMLLDKLDNNKNVSMRDLQNTLGINAVNEFKKRWSEEKENRFDVKNKPQDIKDYEKMLRRADFENNKADGIRLNKLNSRNKNPAKSALALRGRAESLYEDVIERAQELVSADATNILWFDRDIDTMKLNPDFESVPRIRTSRSLNNMKRNIKAVSKEDIKRDILQSYLDKSNVNDKVDINKLKGMLIKLKKSSN
jgi:hypothetical protein